MDKLLESKKEMVNKLELLTNSMQFIVLHQIWKDYPDLSQAYELGKYDYETLLKIYNEREAEKLKKFIEEYNQKAGVNDANS